MTFNYDTNGLQINFLPAEIDEMKSAGSGTLTLFQEAEATSKPKNPFWNFGAETKKFLLEVKDTFGNNVVIDANDKRMKTLRRKYYITGLIPILAKLQERGACTYETAPYGTNRNRVVTFMVNI